MPKVRFLFNYIYSDLRKNSTRLTFVITSYALGLGILIALISYTKDFSTGIDIEAKSLLAADLTISNNSQIPNEVFNIVKNLKQSPEVSFSSLMYVKKSGSSRLIQVRAISGEFPFYGELNTQPVNSFINLSKDQNSILVDKSLVEQFNLLIGDEIGIGNNTFKISGIINTFPGESYSKTMIIPKVFIPFESIPKTELLKKGSRVNHKLHLYSPDLAYTNHILSNLKGIQPKFNFEIETIEDRKNRLGNSLKIVSQFLIMISVISTLLGILGVTSTLFGIIKEQQPIASVLRCLGATSKDVLRLFLVEIIFISGISSVLGALCSLLFLRVLPYILSDFLPFSFDVTFHWKIILGGIFFGITSNAIAALASLLPILSNTPLEAIREAYNTKKNISRFYYICYFALVSICIYAGTYLLLRNNLHALIFTSFIIGSVFLISQIYLTISFALKRFQPKNLGFNLSYTLAGLYRINNHNRAVVVTLSLTMLIFTTIIVSRHAILHQFKESGSANRPNMVLFDVQPDQQGELDKLLRDNNIELISKSPIVTMRLDSVNQISNYKLREDKEIPPWTLKREYRSSYRDRLLESEILIEGSFIGTIQDKEAPIPVTVDSGIAKDLKLKIGDEVVFDVQGIKVTCKISGIRKVNWRRIQTNFFFLFPNGILEQAPQFYAVMTRVDNGTNNANFQAELISKLPNISAIDLNLILDTADIILKKVALVIEFLALFSLVSGLLILMGSISSTRVLRIREFLLLKTLGATQAQLFTMSFYEFLLLGVLSSTIGLMLGIISSWGICLYFFETAFLLPLFDLTLLFLGEVSIVIIVGVLATIKIYQLEAKQILRY